MEEIEEFAVEEFGAEAPDNSAQVEGLQGVLRDLHQQWDTAADEVTKQRIGKAINATKAEIDSLTGSSAPASVTDDGVPDDQWANLQRACAEFHGDDEWFVTRVEQYGGRSHATWRAITDTHKELLAASAAVKPTRKPRAKKTPLEVSPDNFVAGGPGPTPEERFPFIMEHAKNLGIDGQLVFDELGFSDITSESCGATLREINRRAHPEQEETEEFGAAAQENKGDTTESSNPAIDNAPASPAVPPNIDPETGEARLKPMLQILDLTEMPEELTTAQIEKLTDIIAGKRAQADRYRDQCEKLVTPLLEGAKAWENEFQGLIRKYAEKHMKRVKTGANKGKLTGKTLHLMTGSISFIKGGGASVEREGEYHAWLAEQLAIFEAADEAKREALTHEFGFKLIKELKADRAKLGELSQLPPGWVKKPVDEFDSFKIK